MYMYVCTIYYLLKKNNDIYINSLGTAKIALYYMINYRINKYIVNQMYVRAGKALLIT